MLMAGDRRALRPNRPPVGGRCVWWQAMFTPSGSIGVQGGQRAGAWAVTPVEHALATAHPHIDRPTPLIPLFG
jgi:hypothetical protein